MGPDVADPNDPGYYRKYAMNIPPPELYYICPDTKDLVGFSRETNFARKVFFGWNNLTQFELDGMNALK